MIEINACSETVSIIEALIFGAGDACVDLSLFSLLSGVALFMVSVVVLRVLGSWVLRRAFAPLRHPKTPPATSAEVSAETPANERLERLPYESPIRSTRRWGRAPR